MSRETMLGKFFPNLNMLSDPHVQASYGPAHILVPAWASDDIYCTQTCYKFLDFIFLAHYVELKDIFFLGCLWLVLQGKHFWHLKTGN